jgi:hypothetical protein
MDAIATVFKSDSIVPQKSKEDLRRACARLEEAQSAAPDWHPGSNETVLDLVHPSLFPLVYGRSPVLKDGLVSLEKCAAHMGNGLAIRGPEVIEKARHRHTYFSDDFSAKFQWLPCEVDIATPGTAKITSYINNLHPDLHADLYRAIEQIISKAVPMLSATLAMARLAHDDRPARITVGRADALEYTDLTEKPKFVEEDALDDDLDEGEDVDLAETLDSDEKGMSYDSDALREWEHTQHIPHCPAPTSYDERKIDAGRLASTFDLQQKFAAHGLQFIVKLANIVLTPDKPAYGGGSWHVEGQANEHICATALYYYDCENITDSYLGFRNSMDDDIDDWDYDQDEYRHHEVLFDIKQNETTVQSIGSVLTREDRLLTFPNCMQHRVAPFELRDRTRPGHRKILALFLVDPFLRIPSTAHVPPQQKHWYTDMVRANESVMDLPPELAENIVEIHGDNLMDLEEAKELRLELMEERSGQVTAKNQRLEEERFNFCEH